MNIYTAGTFDLFHTGHVRFLRRCAVFGQVLVAVNTDEFVERYKGRKPVIPLEDRIEVLAACRHVSSCFPYLDNNPKSQILKTGADVIAIGSDWAGKDYYGQMGFTQEWLDKTGVQLIYLPYTPHISSSEVRECLSQRS